MVKTTQNSNGLFRRYYTKISNEYNNIVNNPHSQIKSDQKMVFGFGSGITGVFSLYMGFQYLTTFSAKSIVGVLFILLAVTLLRVFNAVIHDFF